MLLNILLLIWGATELIIGGVVATKKKLLFLNTIIESFSYINREFHIERIDDIRSFSTWIGETILVEGALYVFLASAAIYFKMNIIIVVIFIIIIETVFFNNIIKGIKTFIRE